MQRVDKNNYYLDIAEAVLERSTCIRRAFGAVIVKNDEIISTGYNGAPRGRKNCGDLGYCMREKLNIPRGERYEMCRSVHAEQNAIISAARKDVIGSTLYLVGNFLAISINGLSKKGTLTSKELAILILSAFNKISPINQKLKSIYCIFVTSSLSFTLS